MFRGQARKGPMDPRRGAGGEKGGMRFNFKLPLHYGPTKPERGPKSVKRDPKKSKNKPGKGPRYPTVGLWQVYRQGINLPAARSGFSAKWLGWWRPALANAWVRLGESGSACK